MKRFIIATLIAMFTVPAHAAEVKEVVTDKGLKAWLVEEHSVPLLAVKISFTGSGSAYDPSGKEGRANMTAALLMEGAGDMNDKAFAEALENHAIRMDMSVDEDFFDTSVECLSPHKETAFSLLGLALTKPRFNSDSIERVKAQTQTILRQQEGNPGYQLQKAWANAAYGDHPYSNPSAGTKDSIPALQRSDFNDVTRKYLTKENIVIAVVGDITEAELKSLLDAHLGGLPDKYAPDTTVAEVAMPSKATTVNVPFDIPQTMVRFGTQGIKRADPDYMSAYVMNTILGGGGSLTSRLGSEIREKRGLAYSVGTQLNPMMHGASWEGMFSTRTEQVGTAKETLISTLKDFADNGVTNIEFSDARDYLTGAFVLNLDSNASIAGFLISMQIHKLGIDYLDRRNKLVMAVTKESVEDMAKRLADPDKLLVVSVGKTEEKK